MPEFEVLTGDCLEVMRTLDASSVDAVVTDPPYGLGFMGKAWDHAVPGAEFWAEALRVAKPGAHLLAFGGTRLYHRLACAIEDAGWEIRDCLMWLYGSGFPKSHDVSKAIDREAGAEREVVGPSYKVPNARAVNPHFVGIADRRSGLPESIEYAPTAPATDLARKWQGWGTALKPAWEPVIMARKPLVGTVAANVTEWGTGGINVDGCRVGTETIPTRERGASVNTDFASGGFTAEHVGRWPANLILEEGTIDAEWTRYFYQPKASKRDRDEGLDSIEIVTVQCSAWENEDQKARLRVDTAQSRPRVIAVSGAPNNDVTEWNTFLFGRSDTAPSRLASRSIIETETSSITDSQTLSWLCRSITNGCTAGASCAATHGGNHAASADRSTPQITITSEWMVSAPGVVLAPSRTRFTISGNAGNPADHPTVKPTDLMRYLCRLVTPPGGLILDPFTGSGSTGKAAIMEGFNFIGIELDPAHADTARRRIEHARTSTGLYATST